MGYDMRTVQEPPKADQDAIDKARAAEQEAFEAYKKLFRQELDAGGGRNASPELKELAKEHDRLLNIHSELADPGYFRLNMGGMSVYTEAMAEIGMVHPSRNPVEPGEWPPYPEDEEDQEAYAAYQLAHRTVSARHTTDLPTIPWHKFGSNDGWHVTPDEITAALAKWDEWNTEDHPGIDVGLSSTIASDYWGKWINYLRRAAQHGGFEVH